MNLVGPLFDRLPRSQPMNLYLILAIALGAVSGVVDAPAGRSAFAPVVTAASVHSERQAAAGDHVILSREDGEGSPGPRSSASVGKTCHAPLAGAATPRAPAVNC